MQTVHLFLKRFSKILTPTHIFLALIVAVVLWLIPAIAAPPVDEKFLVRSPVQEYGGISPVNADANFAPLRCPAGCEIEVCIRRDASDRCVAFETQCDNFNPECAEEPPPPPAPPVISGNLNCSIWSPSGWCLGALSLDLAASDAGGNAVMIAGDVNGVQFACPNQNTSTLTCSIPLTNEGVGTVNFTVYSVSGLNTSGATNYYLDKSTPQINGVVNCINGLSNWCISNAVVSASAMDSVSGIAVFTVSVDGGASSAYAPITLNDGVHTVIFSATDRAGNSNQVSQTVQVDTTTPSLNISLSGVSGNNGWYKSNVQASVTSSDAGSGISSLEISLDGGAFTPYTTPILVTDGIHTLVAQAKDNAGNLTESTQIIKVDTITPTVTVNLTGTQGLGGWYVSKATITPTANDSGSGIAALQVSQDGLPFANYSFPIIFSDGIHTYQFKTTDNAGNVTQTAIQTVKVDTVTPTLNLVVNGTQGTGGWYASTVTIIPVDTDATSGIFQILASQDGGAWSVVNGALSFADGVHTYQFKVTDNAGLVTETPALTISIDTIPPVVDMDDSISLGHRLYYGLQDDGSGLSIMRAVIEDDNEKYKKIAWDDSLSGDKVKDSILWDSKFADGAQAPIGEYFITLKVKDAAGNETIRTCVVSVGLLSSWQDIPAFIAPSSTTSQDDQITPIAPPTSFGGETSGNQISETSSFSISTMLGGEGGTSASAYPTTNVISSGGVNNQISTAHSTSNFGANSTTNSQSADFPTSTILWGTAAAAAVGAFLADAQRRKEEERAAQEAERLERIEKMDKTQEAMSYAQISSAYVYWMGVKEQKEQQQKESERAILVNRNIFIDEKMANIERNDDAKWTASQIAIQKRVDENLQAGLAAYYSAMRQGEEEAQKNWWEKTKSFIDENIIQPVMKPAVEKINEEIFQPYIKPEIERRLNLLKSGITWLNESVYQPHIKPKIEQVVEGVKSGLSWVNDNFFQPYVIPEIKRELELLKFSLSWVNDNFYQPYIQPKIEQKLEAIKSDISWLNENFYQPYLKPAIEWELKGINSGISWMNENFYQPMVAPILGEIEEMLADGALWVNDHVYQPFIQPVMSDINRYIYRPLTTTTEELWGKYGEWVHNGLDAVGFIPGLGDAADGINGLIYLGEGRYIEAGVSMIAMIPLLGDLGKAGKWTVKAGQEILEEVVEKVAKEAAEELMEVAVKETAGEIAEEAIEKTLKEAGEELTTKVVKDSLEEATEQTAEKALKETSEELIAKATKDSLEEVVKETTQKTLKEVGEEIVAKVTKGSLGEIAEQTEQNILKDVSEELVTNGVQEIFEETIEKTLKETSKELIEEIGEDVGEKITENVIEETAEKFFRGELGDLVIGDVSKLPDDILKTLGTDPDPSLVNKFEKKLAELVNSSGAQPVHIDISTGTYYVSKTYDEAKSLISEAKKLVSVGETGKAIEKVRELAKFFKRGTGSKAIIGGYPTYIKYALKNGGVFFDVGESWVDLVKLFGDDKYASFLANEEFLYILKDCGVESVELVTELSTRLDDGTKTTIKLLDWLDEFNSASDVAWEKMSYGQMEVLALETSPMFSRISDTKIWTIND